MSTNRGSSSAAVVAVVALVILAGAAYFIWWGGADDDVVIHEKRTIEKHVKEEEKGDTAIFDIDLLPDREDKEEKQPSDSSGS